MRLRCKLLDHLLIDCASVLLAPVRHERAKDLTRELSQQRCRSIIVGKVMVLLNTCKLTQIVMMYQSLWFTLARNDHRRLQLGNHNKLLDCKNNPRLVALQKAPPRSSLSESDSHMKSFSCESRSGHGSTRL